MKKKVLAVLALLFLVLGLSGCGLEKKENSNEVSKKETLALDDVRFYYIYQTLSEYTYKDYRENGYKSFSDVELFNIAITRLKESDLTFSYEEDFIKYYTFSKKILIDYLKDCFGEDVDFDSNSIVNRSYETKLNPNYDGSGMEVYNYDPTNEVFTVRFGGDR